MLRHLLRVGAEHADREFAAGALLVRLRTEILGLIVNNVCATDSGHIGG